MSDPVAQTLRVKFVALSGIDLRVPSEGSGYIYHLGTTPRPRGASQSQGCEVGTPFTA
jgi:hypothetical protein